MREPFIFVGSDLFGAAEVPAEIQLVPSGVIETAGGSFVVDDVARNLIVANFNKRKNDTVIDYEHQTLAGVEAPASGWIKKIIDRGSEGIWAAVEWTSKARQYIQDKQYRYLSPVLEVRKSDRRPINLLNAGLTNQPAIDGMAPLAFKLQFNQEEESMKGILKALGLADDATEDAAVEAIKKLQTPAQVIASKAVFEAAGLEPTATEAQLTGTIVALKQGHTQSADLATEVKALKESLAARDAGELVQLALKDGKITPAQQEWAADYAKKDPEGFKVFVCKATPVVPLGGGKAGEEKGKTTDGLDETQLQVNKALGISTEQFKKHCGGQK